MVKPYLLWPACTGTIALLGGLVAVRRPWSAASGWDKLIALGPLFVAVPLATFGAEHMVNATFIARMVPVWLPGRLFWAYFVGLALFAAAASLILRRHVRLSATLLGVMFFLFVTLMHVPNVAADPGNRFMWAIAFRDLSFGGGGLALAATQTERWRARGTHWLLAAGRLMIALPLLFFGFEHLLHPEFAPGVPLPKMAPAWIPVPAAWGYATGAAEIAAAGAVLMGFRARTAATWLGLLMLLLTAVVYSPMLVTYTDPPARFEGLNYVADTLLFAGTILVLAGAVRERKDPEPVLSPR